MKTTITTIISGLITLVASVSPVFAQAPSSLAGDGFLAGVLSGAYPLASYGYYLFIPANSGSTYQVIGIYNVFNSSGTYTYTPTSVSSATLNINDSVGGAGVLSASFTSANSGTYYETATSYPSAYQSGDFGFSSFNAPTTLTGMTLNCSVVNGAYPFNTSGSYTITIANSGNTYTASTGQSGTYSYSTLNRCTGMVQLNDSVTGATTAYFGFSSTTGGGYALTQATAGGFQVGTFSISNTSPWPDATSLGNGWMTSNWFGTFNVNNYPWIYHQQHGWMYVFGTDPNSIWLWTSDLGFLWTSQSVYPWLWSDAQQTWLYYSVGSSNPRYFYNWNTQKWVAVNL
jgi:hypothetical protein